MVLPEHVWTFIRDIHAPPPNAHMRPKCGAAPYSTWPESPVGEFTYAHGSGLGRGEQRQPSRAALRAKDKAYRAAQAWVLNRFEWAHLPGVAEELVDDENPPLAPQVECHRQAVQLKGHQHEHERLQPSHLQVRSFERYPGSTPADTGRGAVAGGHRLVEPCNNAPSMARAIVSASSRSPARSEASSPASAAQTRPSWL